MPIRLHVERDGGGMLNVWIGADASAAPRVPELAAVVARWCAASGYGAPRLICNGERLPDSTLTSAGTRRQSRTGFAGAFQHQPISDSAEAVDAAGSLSPSEEDIA